MIDPAPPKTPLPLPAPAPAGREAGRGAKNFDEAGRGRSGEPKFLEKRGGGGAGFQNKLRIGAGAGSDFLRKCHSCTKHYMLNRHEVQKFVYFVLKEEHFCPCIYCTGCGTQIAPTYSSIGASNLDATPCKYIIMSI